MLEDGHLNLRERGDAAGYVLVAPSNPRMTWSAAEDEALIDLVRRVADEFQLDARRIHVTGFSRGGYVTWRLLCDHADLFASAAPAAAGLAARERTCFTGGRAPSREIPILFLMGRTDHQVSYGAMVAIRDAALASYGAGVPQVLSGDASYTHTRWTGRGSAVLETFDHAYETINDGPWGFALGHCVPGSTSDPYARQYALPCRPPNAFTWGEEVMRFFRAHPMR